MHLIEHRLAGAVVADERGDLARADVEVDVGERLHRAEVLDDALQAEERAASPLSLLVIGSASGPPTRAPVRARPRRARPGSDRIVY